MNSLEPTEYSLMTYRQLQKIAKVRGLKANNSSSVIINNLIQYDNKKIEKIEKQKEKIEKQKEIKNRIIQAENQYAYWYIYHMIPKGVRTDLHMCKYIVSGQDHDGYCSGNENETFEPYFIFKGIEKQGDDIDLKSLSYVEEGCSNSLGYYRFCDGEAYKCYEALEIIPFYSPYLIDIKKEYLNVPKKFTLNAAARVIQRCVTRWFYRPDSKYVQKIIKDLQKM